MVGGRRDRLGRRFHHCLVRCGRMEGEGGARRWVGQEVRHREAGDVGYMVGRLFEAIGADWKAERKWFEVGGDIGV